MSTSPNPGEVEKIPSNPKSDNPARYGYEQGPGRQGYENEKASELEPTPVVTIGPNVVYIVDPGAKEKIEDAIEGNGGTEPADEVPTLSAIEPNQLPVWAQDTTVTFVGTNFTSVTEIIWNGSGEPTTYVDAEHVTTIVKPSTVEPPPPVTVQAWVANGSLESAHLDFTFIA